MTTFAKRLMGLATAAMLTASLPAAEKDIIDTAVAAGNFKTLAAALQAADWVTPLKGKGPFTVFAPTDEAFAALPPGTVERLLEPKNKALLGAILTYHVVPGKHMAADVTKLTGATTVNGQRVDLSVNGSTVMVDKARVVKADIACGNGVIHVIDAVIMPSAKDIPTTATEAGQFKTLLAAAKAGGIDKVLIGEGPFTLFAPTDAAFAKLPAGTVEMLLKPENKEQLVAVLKYHVVPGRVYSTDAVANGEWDTAQGKKVTVKTGAGGAMVNHAKLLSTDLDASNGVIHVIDAVLMPPS